jgi:glycosyltransferase involved in cell wall biosynthesis
MRIVIDLQGAQTGSRFRGIGRYTTAVTRSLLRHAETHEIWLVLNGALFESIAAIRASFAGLLPQERIVLFEPPAPCSDLDPQFEIRTQAADILREHFIARLRPDVVLVTSLFESYVEHAVVSVGRLIDPARTAVILYDLIPFLNPATYLTSPLVRTLYMAKIDALKRAGLLLSISDYARAEAIDALGLDPARVVAISTAVDESFVARPMASGERSAIRQQFGVTRAMLLYAPGGYDKRKNLHGLISAYALLPAHLRSTHQLVVASGLTKHHRADLIAHARACGLAADELLLTGYVSDAHLIGLYQCAALFVFPSLHEGFGLPALEAMACGAPVIGSNNTSLPEVIGLAEAMFDPASTAAMSQKIAEALGDPAMLARLRHHGRAQAARFSWDATALRALRALEARAASAEPLQAPPDQAQLLAALAGIPGIAQDKQLLLELAFCVAALPDAARSAHVFTAARAQADTASQASRLLLSDAGNVWHYRHAHGDGSSGMVADLHTGDTVADIDLAAAAVLQAASSGLYDHLHRLGVSLCFSADARVLPVVGLHAATLGTLLARAERVVCSSADVAEALRTCGSDQKNTPQLVVQHPPATPS